MPAEPLVTSILITYNHRDSIEQAIQSILNQRTTFAHKVIIRDDCSTDGTTEVCQEYARRYPELIEFEPSELNQGLVENIFAGLTQVRSEFFATLEGDDYWCDSSKLEKQVNGLRQNPHCSFCGHNTRYESGDANNDARVMFSESKYNIKNEYEFPSRFTKRNFVKVHPSSRLYRTSTVDFSKLKFKGSLVWDSSAYWYFLSKGNLLYIDEIMSVYRITGRGVFTGSPTRRQRFMSIYNNLNINDELDFKYHKLFMPRALRHRNLLGLNWIDCINLRYRKDENFQKYNQLRDQVRQQLNLF